MKEVPGCPKHMTHGPCGGVMPNGQCEAAAFTCPWTRRPTAQWSGPRPAGSVPHTLLSLMQQRPVVVADLSAPACDRNETLRSLKALTGHVDAVLTGDLPGARVQFPPSFLASLVHTVGAVAWVGLNCRDRNRVALEGELAALAAIGVGGVHCVTGDHPAVGHRPDAQPVFDLDSTELAALARSAGLLVSVAEAPCSPPVSARAVRLVEKVRAGAQVCFVNHAGGADPVARFVAAVSMALDAPIPFIACVPLILDRASAELISGFPGLVLPPGYVEGILDSRDPHRAGTDAALRLCSELLGIPGIRGIDISTVPVPGRELQTARAVAAVGQELGAGG